MIHGITVLNNITISDFNPIPWLCTIIVFLAVCILICIKIDDCYTQERKGIGLSLVAIFVIMLMSFIADIRFSKVDVIQCTIDDCVSINEVYDKYEVIDKQGEIWTLRERTNEKA